MKDIRLGVNIDHVATLRQQRGELYPSLEHAAQLVLEAGADQITIHLREDARHIQPYDVPCIQQICLKYKKPLNLEMGCADSVISLGVKVKPAWICLVPEKREERTTEGGLNLLDRNVFFKVQETIAKFRADSPQTKISLFVEADEKVLTQVQLLNVDAIEIHTGDFARDFNLNHPIDRYQAIYRKAFEFCLKHKMGCHAGHGLTNKSLSPLLHWGYFQEYNIGHWIISESIFTGLAHVVTALKQQMTENS
jgi:pyridoxine 5-phosphate synthase